MTFFFILYIDGKQYFWFYFCFALGFKKKNDGNYNGVYRFFYRDELIKCLAQPTRVCITSNVSERNQAIVKNMPTTAT